MFMIQVNSHDNGVTFTHSTHEERTFRFATAHLSQTIDALAELLMAGNPENVVDVHTHVARHGNSRVTTAIHKNDILIYEIRITEI